jgi:hypothetical protein
MPYADPAKRREKQPEYDRRRAAKLGKAGMKEKNARAYRSSGRNNHLRRSYGLSEQGVNWMLVEQGGECAICQCDISEKHCVDHNHTTGKVRRLLCYRCNIGIFAMESPGWKKIAEKYLEDHA